MKNCREAGESCVLRGIVNNQVWLAQSVIVVKDGPEETVLVLLPGAHCAFPEGYWLWRKNLEMVHIVQVLDIIPAGIRRASAGRARSFLAIVPAGLRSWVNGHIVVPSMSRNATRASLADQYNKAHNALVDILMALPENAWSKGMPYPKKYRTVEQMAHRPAEHFEEHSDHLRNVLGIKIEDI